MSETTEILPCCDGMTRKEITELLGQELIWKRLTKRNAYTFWAHEVEVPDNNTAYRVDFMQFEPVFGRSAGRIEQGTFTCYEVKSSIEDLKSGHGLNFYGDRNFIVAPIEVYEKFYKLDFNARQKIDIPWYVGWLVYGKTKRGHKKLVERHVDFLDRCFRERAASELLFCMMRALVANSNHSNVDHQIKGVFASLSNHSSIAMLLLTRKQRR